MKFSIKVQYGIQALLELAVKYGGGLNQIGDIAQSQKIPVRYLEQILLILKKKGLVSSSRGKEGGYSLLKHPADVSVLEIIECLDGPIELSNKKMKKVPVVFEAFEKIQNNIINDLRELTLEDMALKKRQKERAYIYNI
ncbi:MAG: Rrf2 family transcriptional regulator [Candidatus Margulisbacteria bacterium]|nr:Rrf2 family transcriptional regulator [Candidatus Margulisiibacteriota bacterium]